MSTQVVGAGANDVEVTQFTDESGVWVNIYVHDPDADFDDSDTVKASILLSDVEALDLIEKLTEAVKLARGE